MWFWNAYFTNDYLELTHFHRLTVTIVSKDRRVGTNSHGLEGEIHSLKFQRALEFRDNVSTAI
jgi:hypothetical protein